jgi:hypothetical protein
MRNKQPSRSISLRPPRASKNAEEKERERWGGAGEANDGALGSATQTKSKAKFPVCSIIASETPNKCTLRTWIAVFMDVSIHSFFRENRDLPSIPLAVQKNQSNN